MKSEIVAAADRVEAEAVRDAAVAGEADPAAAADHAEQDNIHMYKFKDESRSCCSGVLVDS